MKKRTLIGLTSLAMVGALAAPAVYHVQPASAAIAAGSVVVNEIMYNYASGTTQEWVELYNNTSSAISLAGYKLTDNNVGASSLTEGTYTFPSGTSIPAGGYLTIGNSLSSAQLKWSGNFALGNSGDGVALFSDSNSDNIAQSGEVIDSVEFTSAWGGNGTGYSLERKDPAGASSSSTNWGSSTTSGGTLGAKNTLNGGGGGGGGGGGTVTGTKVLWDQGHGQTAGNADWTIGGANSSFADALRAKGYTVASTTSAISSTVLSGYKVLVLPEPNTNYTSTEKSAINTFISNGGGVYFIADHIVSDRNNDGWDSVQIFDGSQTEAYPSTGSWVGATFGFYFNRNNLVQEPITDIRANSVTSGVTSVGAWNGSTIHVTGANSTILSDIFLTGQADPFHIHGKYGSGRFAALGDSSLYDDGTGASGKNLYDGWTDYSDAKLAVNTIDYLAGVIN
ncbi:lamin tail domain-containing protein [Tumebacillus sp. ITR2]|uniref:Lamin tail domain-containing protein n=1 Tax=Tumebacillus amylolyticus TaxID=2801339 RepID=A0ABS1J877_9BACL|nr:lamin tail domain-containing protein [Tumebacillus amylolyticus]MBL0386471.1 lamin tail domain-containing protein [Tumebacillus amylolyticus]